jgi:aspartyl-tRNA(Asn)/glutamyl-tRNA(Gln) amidotransferase subunit C
MRFTDKDVRRLARLSRLALEPEEIERFQQDLSQILDLAQKLQSIDTSNVEPLAHPGSSSVFLRPDQVTETNQREVFQAVAPEVDKGLYLVPRVVE